VIDKPKQTALACDPVDRLNNATQALVLKQYLQGVRITIINPGDVQYIGRKRT
jgi:hypothetical protein